MNVDLKKNSPALLAVLSSFVALGPLSTDMYLPAFPTLVSFFDTSMTQVQLTLSAYLCGFCFFHLICGPLSDRFGRKPILLFGMIVFLFASIGCSFVDSIEQLIVWRFVQGIGACTGPTIARAMVRDIYGPVKAVNALAYMAAIMALAPVVAPIIGGWMLNFWSWTSIFVFVAGYSVICIALLIWRVPESLPEKQSILFSVVFKNYWQLIKHRRFRMSVLAASFLYAGMFAFVSASSFILIDFMGVAADQFGYWFMFIVVGYMLGNLFTGRYSHMLSSKQLMLTGVSIAVMAGLVMALLSYLKIYHPLIIVLPAALYAGSTGITLPQSMAMAMAPFAHMAGTASALMGFVQMAMATIATVAMGLLLTGEPLTLAIIFASCASISLVLFVLLFKAN